MCFFSVFFNRAVFWHINLKVFEVTVEEMNTYPKKKMQLLFRFRTSYKQQHEAVKY